MSLRLTAIEEFSGMPSPLVRAALAERIGAPWLGGLVLPRSLDALHAPALVSAGHPELASALRTATAALSLPAAAQRGIEELAQPAALAVVAGQQPGLLGGPLYDLYKGLHAIALARALRAAWQRPVVPILWSHADDHDVAEVHHAWVSNEHYDLRKLGLSGLSSGRMPVGEIALDEEQHKLGALRALLEQLLPSRDSRAAALKLGLPRSGETLSDAFARFHSALLGGEGLVLLSPRWIRPALSSALARIVRAGPQAALASASARLRAAGHDAAIDPGSAALLFAHDSGGRRALRCPAGRWQLDGGADSWSDEELAQRIEADPLPWSPGALLRPIAQDIALPTCAYVGGLGELAYHLQLAELRRACGLAPACFVPRLSCTLIPQDCADSLQTLGLALPDVLAGRASLTPPKDERATPAVAEELRAIAVQAARELNARREAMTELDRGLAIQLRQTADQVRQVVEKLVQKAERVQMNRSGRGTRHYRRLSATLLPRGEPQERVWTTCEAVARHGFAWIPELLAAIGPFPPAHLAVALEPAPEPST